MAEATKKVWLFYLTIWRRLIADWDCPFWNQCYSGATMRFVFWFFGFATSVVFTVLAMVGMPDFASASGYGLILAIPNIVLLLVCGLIGWVCLHSWKAVRDASIRVKINTVIGYMLLLGILLLFFYGEVEVKIQVVDSDRRPVSRISVKTTRQKGSNFVSIFLPDDLVANVTTDADGYASIQTNYYQVLYGSVNPPPYNKGTTVNYQHASFDAYPIGHGEMRVTMFWEKIGEIGGPSMHEYHLEHFVPGKETLVIFLPRKGGTDKFSY